MNYEMPWYFLSWVLGSDIYLYQETLYRSESCFKKVKEDFTLRSSRDGYSSSSNISSTLHLFRNRLQVHLASVSCTFSTFFVSVSLKGCQIGAAYSSWGAEDKPMFCMQLPLYSEVQEPNCAEENPLQEISETC